MIIDKPHQIELYRLAALKSMLKLEILGMKRHGRSAYSIAKEEFGIKGNKKKVLEQITELIRIIKQYDVIKGGKASG